MGTEAFNGSFDAANTSEDHDIIRASLFGVPNSLSMACEQQFSSLAGC